jgi:hypothetical protein
MLNNTIPEFLANVPNIEHCSIRTIGNPAIMYVITTDDGWYIHRNDGDEGTANIWKTTTAIRNDEDPAMLQIVPESELPPDAEILAERPENEIASEGEDEPEVT